MHPAYIHTYVLTIKRSDLHQQHATTLTLYTTFTVLKFLRSSSSRPSILSPGCNITENPGTQLKQTRRTRGQESTLHFLYTRLILDLMRIIAGPLSLMPLSV